MFAVLSLLSVGPEKDTRRYEPSPVSAESFVGFRVVTGEDDWMGHLLCFFVLFPSVETCPTRTCDHRDSQAIQELSQIGND